MRWTRASDQSAAPIRELRKNLEEQRSQGESVDPKLEEELQRLEAEYDADKQFAAAIKRFGRVVLGNFFLYTEADLRGMDDAALNRYASSLQWFSLTTNILTTEKTGGGAPAPEQGKKTLANFVESYRDAYLLPSGAVANIEPLTGALNDQVAGTGFFDIFSDADGVLRRTQLILPYGRSKNYTGWDFYSSLELQVIRLYDRLPPQDLVLNFNELGAVSIDFGTQLSLQPDHLGRYPINFHGPQRTYSYYSANVIDNILHQGFLIRGANQELLDLALIFLFGIPLGIWMALVNPRWMWFGLGLLVPFVGMNYWAFLRGQGLNFSLPFLTIVSNVLLVALYRALVEEKEKRKVRGAFQQYLSPEVVRRLLENPKQVEPRKTEVTVMFSDVRGFSAISEQLDAQELALFLNEYLTDMTRIVFDHQGTLDKYIGDAVMAFWGAPFEEPQHAAHACTTALKMMSRIRELQEKWKREGKPHLDVGVGLNSGIASVGNMGSVLRYGYTAMGDAVNLSSRLEALNREYGTHIIVGETTFAESRSAGFLFRELDLIRVKGKLRPVKIYELIAQLDGDTAPSAKELADWKDRIELFARARTFYQKREWSEAWKVFNAVLVRWPDDGPARLFLERCKEFRAAGPGADWDGVYIMTHK